MTVRIKSAVLRVPLLVLAALFLGGVAAIVAGITYHAGRASAAATDPQCSFPSGAPGPLLIDLFGSTVTLKASGSNLVITPNGSCGGASGFAFSNITAIQFEVDSTTTSPTTVVLDQTGGIFSCSIPVEGAVGSASAGNGIVKVVGADGENITVGSTGVNLNGCGSVGTLTAVAEWDLSDTNGALSSAVTFSAAGGAFTGSAASVPVTMTAGTQTHTLPTGSTFTGGSDTDTYTVFGNGNTFVVGSGTDTITDTGAGNTLDLGSVQASASTHLVVNVSGSSQTIGGTTVKSGQADLGSGLADTFNASAFTIVDGAVTGNTDFLAGDTGGLTFNARSTSGNSADFTAATQGVEVDFLVTTNNVFGGNLSADDTLSNITNVTGSSAGNNFFVAGSASSYSFTGDGNNNEFFGFLGSGTDTFVSNGTGNQFLPGSGNATFIDPTPGNTVDLSIIGSTPAVVDVSGVAVTGASNDTATAGSATYTFSQLAEPTTFIGSTGGTKFFAGSAADSFDGQGLASDTLSYASASGTPLTMCVGAASSPCTASGQAVLAGVTAKFSSIRNFDGLAGGSTTFVSGGSNGSNFIGTGTANVADYTHDPNPVTADLGAGTVTDATGTDTLSDISTVFGAAGGQNVFLAGSNSETFGDNGSGHSDTVNFANVSTSGTTPLTVNLSGKPANGAATSTAVVGTTTYTFNTKASNFTTFLGSGSGNTSFLAGNAGGLTFTAATGTPGNSADFSAATSGVDVDLTIASNNVSGPSLTGTDTITNITIVTGSSAGGSTFHGGTAAATFTGKGSGNTFVAGTASDTFIDPTSGNTVDLSNIGASPAVVDVSGVGVAGANNDTATAGGATYNFTLLTEPTTFVGSTGGTRFFAGSAADTFDGQGLASDTLSYGFASGGPLTVCVGAASSPCTAGGQAVLGGVTESFAGVKTFDGLAGGSTTFVSGAAAGDSFVAAGLGNTADYTHDANAITADLGAGTITDATGTDSISDVSTVFGSSGGHNVFVAGSGSETFGDNGSNRTDTVSFINVPTSSTTQLTVNLSGTPANGALTSTAVVGTATYTFNNKVADFTTFVGSSSGNTNFLAGDAGGLTFTAINNSPGNSADFSAATAGVDVDLTSASNNVTGPSITAPDTITNLTSVTGSSAGHSTFHGGSATASFTGKGSGNVFVAGTANATFIDPTPGNTVDLSQIASLATVDVSGVGVTPTNNDTATAGGATYTFSQLAEPTVFIGSTGGTHFFAGSAADTFDGQGKPTDTLSYGFAPGSPLTLCVGAFSAPCTSAGQAVLGGVTEFFGGIKTFDGLAGGSTTFVSGGANSDHFVASGPSNTADYSQDPNPVTADFVAGTVVDAASSDTFSGISSIVGSAAGHNTFVAGSTSEIFGDPGLAGGDAVDFANVSASSSTPLLVNVSGHPVSGVNSDTASVGSVTYNFTNGASNFQIFIGSGSGNTRFAASDAIQNLTFDAGGSGNTADFGLSTLGVTADITPVSGGAVSFSAIPPAAPAACPTTSTPAADRLGGTFLTLGNTIIGSSSAANTFFGDVTGTTFTSQSSSNTVSYCNVPVPLNTAGVTVNLSTDRVSGGAGAPDTFSFPVSSTPTIQGSPATDVFMAGITPATLEGGGGVDTLNLTQTLAPPFGNSGDFVDLQDGSVTGSGIGGLTFATGCASATSMCVTSIVGSRFNDTYQPTSGALGVSPLDFLTITGGTGSDTLDLASVTNSADVCLPILGTSPLGTVPCTSTGLVQQLSGAPNPATFSTPAPISFTGVANVVGTSPGGDYVWGGTGTEQMQDSGAATLDLSNLPGIASGGAGATVTAGSSQAGTVTTPLSANATYSWSGFENLTGTRGNDAFTQTAPGTFNFNGLGGTNTLDMSAVTGAATMSFNSPVPADGCTGTTNSDGSATSTQLTDHWTCMSSVIAPGQSSFAIFPGQTAQINGGGSGTLRLVGDVTGNGATVDMTTTPGTVSNDGYNFSFTGISTIVGTPFNDTFMPGASNVTINGGGGQDGLSYLGAPNAVDVNLSTANYLVPSGYFDAGNSLSACSAIGGFGGTVNFGSGPVCTIANATGSLSNTDVLVAGRGQSNLTGGAGSDRFVLTNGGNDQIVGGSGGSSLDLTQLSGHTTVDLGNPGTQPLGSGSLTLVSGNIKNVLASPGGSTLFGGTGNGVTLVGGPGNDVLAAGTGTQTLQGGGGSDLLLGGVGNDTMIGGAQPVTFVPGEGHDTLQSGTTGNTLTYAGAIQAIRANLSSQPFSVPAGKPFAGTVLAAQSVTGGFPGSSVDLSQAPVGHLTGSPFGDVLVTGGNDVISGGGGGDLFVIEAGSSTLDASSGSSSYFLFEGAGSEIVNGGGNSTVDFSAAPHGVTVNLQAGDATGGFGDTQTLSGIKDVIGTNSADVLVAGGPGERLTGLNGKDLLQAGPSGDDTLVGGAGPNDTFCSESGCAVAGTAAAGGATQATENVMTGGSGNDTFFTRNGGFDSIDGGGGFNQAQTDSHDTAVNIQVFLP